MAILDVTTEHGTRYILDFDKQFWIRIKRGYMSQINRIWSFKVGTELAFPWNAPDAWEDAKEPELGKHLYVASRDEWYVSTLVTDITEVEDFTEAAKKARESMYT